MKPDPIDLMIGHGLDHKSLTIFEAKVVDEIVGQMKKAVVSPFAGIPVITCDALPDDTWMLVSEAPTSGEVLRAYEESFTREVERRATDWRVGLMACWSTDPRSMAKITPFEMAVTFRTTMPRECTHEEHFTVYRDFMLWEDFEWPDD